VSRQACNATSEHRTKGGGDGGDGGGGGGGGGGHQKRRALNFSYVR